MIIKIIIIVIGIIAFVGSFFHNKEKHKRFGESTSSTATSDSIIATFIGLIISFLLSIAPFWVTKFLFLLISAGLIFIGIFLI